MVFVKINQPQKVSKMDSDILLACERSSGHIDTGSQTM
jgi:hypothetical protein